MNTTKPVKPTRAKHKVKWSKLDSETSNVPWIFHLQGNVFVHRSLVCYKIKKNISYLVNWSGKETSGYFRTLGVVWQGSNSGRTNTNDFHCRRTPSIKKQRTYASQEQIGCSTSRSQWKRVSSSAHLDVVVAHQPPLYHPNKGVEIHRKMALKLYVARVRLDARLQQE